MVTLIKKFFPLIVIVFFLLISILIASIWLRSGFTAAGGETSFLLFGTKKPFDEVGYWVERGSSGKIDSFSYVNYPLKTIIYFFQQSGVETPILQKILFVLLIFSGLTGCYLLINKFFNNKRSFLIPILGGMFYFFNLFSMSQIFRRFIYGGIFTWAYLPISLLLFILFIKRGGIKQLCLYLITSLIFIPSFSHPSFLLVIWVPAFLYSLHNYIDSESKELKLRILKRSLLVFFLWLLVNIWWLYPYFTLGVASVLDPRNNVSTWENNLSSLQGVTKYFSNWDVLTLKQKFYFGSFEYWDFPLYSSFLGNTLSLVVFVIAFSGVIIFKRSVNFRYILVLTILTWLIVKGTNPPLGNAIFTAIFKLNPKLGVLRNSYEKFGSIWVLCYSVFFAHGFGNLIQSVNQRFRLVLGLLVTASVFVVLVYPMWTGEIYSKGLLVKTPPDYEEVNKYLNTFRNDGRVLVIPIISDYGVRYDWHENGEYNGVNPLIYSLEKSLLTGKFSDKYALMQQAFYDQGDYESFLKDYNIKYLLLNEDFDQLPQLATKSADVRKIVNKNAYIKLLQTIGKFEVYEYTPNGNDEYPSLFSISSGSAKVLDYVRVKPTEFEIYLDNNEGDFVLVFKETYDPHWTASVNGIKINDHSMVLDYANAWKINKKGKYNVNVDFAVWPEMKI